MWIKLNIVINGDEMLKKTEPRRRKDTKKRREEKIKVKRLRQSFL